MKSYPYVIEPSQLPPIPLDEAKDWLRIDRGVTDDDLTVSAVLASAIETVERDAGVSLRPATYEWYTHGWPCEIPARKITAISEIAYHDGTDYVVLDAASYRLVRTGENAYRLMYGDLSAFSYQYRGDGIRIRFIAGYDEPPAGLLQAVRARLSEFYDNRGDGVSEKRTLSDKLVRKYQLPYAG